MLKLPTILYTDDTIMVSNSVVTCKLKDKLNCYEFYCKYWKLKINTKNKLVLFGGNARLKYVSVTLAGDEIEVVK